MGFWIFMLVMNLLIPATMAGFGRAFLKKAPGKINYAFGYRTSMSMKIRIPGTMRINSAAGCGMPPDWLCCL